MSESKIILHNKSGKPDNVVERENEIQDRCEKIESELPKWMRGYFMYLKTSVLPMTRLSYLGDVRFFFNYLLKESVIAEKGYSSISQITPEDLDRITAVDVNIFIDYCRRYKVKNKDGEDVLLSSTGTKPKWRSGKCRESSRRNAP